MRPRAWILVSLLAGTLAAVGSGGDMPAYAQSDRPSKGIDEAGRALAAGDAERAARLAAAHLNEHPDDPRARVLLARVHLERDELTAAYDQLERALDANPRDVDALYYMGLVAGHLAAVAFQRLHEVAPGSARVHQLQAETFEAQDRRADAEREYEAALDQDPALLDALLGLARLKRIRLACDEAVALYGKAEAIRPTYDGAYGRAMCLSTLQNDREAVTHFELAVKRDGKSALALAGLGTSLVKLGRVAEGIARLERAVTLQPDLSEAHYMLGMAYRTAGKPRLADQAFRKAEQLRAVDR